MRSPFAKTMLDSINMSNTARRVDLRSLITGVSPEAYKLLEACLNFDPHLRCSAEQVSERNGRKHNLEAQPASRAKERVSQSRKLGSRSAASLLMGKTEIPTKRGGKKVQNAHIRLACLVTTRHWRTLTWQSSTTQTRSPSFLMAPSSSTWTTM